MSALMNQLTALLNLALRVFSLMAIVYTVHIFTCTCYLLKMENFAKKQLVLQKVLPNEFIYFSQPMLAGVTHVSFTLENVLL